MSSLATMIRKVANNERIICKILNKRYFLLFLHSNIEGEEAEASSLLFIS